MLNTLCTPTGGQTKKITTDCNTCCYLVTTSIVAHICSLTFICSRELTSVTFMINIYLLIRIRIECNFSFVFAFTLVTTTYFRYLSHVSHLMW